MSRTAQQLHDEIKARLDEIRPSMTELLAQHHKAQEQIYNVWYATLSDEERMTLEADLQEKRRRLHELLLPTRP